SLQAIMHFGGCGDNIRNSRITYFAFGGHQPVRHGRQRYKKSPRNLVGLKAAQCAQGQSRLRLWGKRRMAAGNNQTKAVIGNFIFIVVRLFALAEKPGLYILIQLLGIAGLATNPVYGFVPRGLNDPSGRNAGDARSWPLAERSSERL